jgi:RNAse (barnase) inhibitor barstar
MSNPDETPFNGKPFVSIEGSNIHDIASFYEEINRVFMRNEEWQLGNSLDAFNDLLYGGFGVLDQNAETDIIWKDMNISREALGYEATKAFYTQKLAPDSPYNKSYHQEKLKELESGKGQTYFDIVLEVIADHPRLNLIAM